MEDKQGASNRAKGKNRSITHLQLQITTVRGPGIDLYRSVFAFYIFEIYKDIDLISGIDRFRPPTQGKSSPQKPSVCYVPFFEH